MKSSIFSNTRRCLQLCLLIFSTLLLFQNCGAPHNSSQGPSSGLNSASDYCPVDSSNPECLNHSRCTMNAQGACIYDPLKMDLDGDGRADLCARGAAGVYCWLSKTGGWMNGPDLRELSDAGGWSYDPKYYQTLHFADINGDGRADLCARGAAGLLCWLSGANGWTPTFGIFTISDAGGWGLPEYYQTMQFADLNNDGRADFCIRGAGGLMCWLASDNGWIPTQGLAALSDLNGWNRPEYYKTIRLVDINGDGRADVCARGAGGLMCWLRNDQGGWNPTAGIPELSDAGSWNFPEYYQTIQFADINGDGKAEVCARGANAFYCWQYSGNAWTPTISLAELSNAGGWNRPEYYQSIRMMDINGDWRADLCARGANGLLCWLSKPEGWSPTFGIATMSDANGWNRPEVYQTLQLADINGDGKADVCARGGDGLSCWTSTNNGWAPSAGLSLLSDSGAWNQKPYYQTLSLGNPAGGTYEISPPTSTPQWSLGYYYPNDGMPVSQIRWSALTHLVVCGASILPDGNLNFDAGWGNLLNVHSEIFAAAHSHNVKVSLLIWVNDEVPMAGTSGMNLINAIQRDGVDTVAARIVNSITQQGYDGVDLDWEWSSSVENPSTRATILSLVKALRAKLGPSRPLTLDAFPSQAQGWTASGAFDYLDRLNVMVYDEIVCCSVTWFNSAIYGGSSFQGALQQYQQAGAPIWKINLGLPFYGWHFWDGSTGPNQPRNPNADTSKREQLPYSVIANRYFPSPNVSYFDNSAHVPWIQTQDGWITYDNEQSTSEKVRFARDNRLGGIAIWEIGQDYSANEPSKRPLNDAVKYSWPGINVSSPEN